MDSCKIWELFKKTGNIGVYILYKKILDGEYKSENREEQSINADSDRGNCDTGNRCF